MIKPIPLKYISIEQVENGYVVDLYPITINNTSDIISARFIYVSLQDVVAHIQKFLGVEDDKNK